MKIKLEELERLTNAFFRALEASGFDELEFSKDFYWSIDSRSLYDPYSPPEKKALTLGQLSSEWQALSKSLDNPERLTSMQLIWLAEIFRYIGSQKVF